MKREDVQSLINIIRNSQQESQKKQSYRQLLRLTTAEELGKTYKTEDFSIYFEPTELTEEDKQLIINGGFYREYSNLLGFSKQPLKQEIDTCQLKKGLLAYTDEKMIPWIEADRHNLDWSYSDFYVSILEELSNLNQIYLAGDADVSKKLKKATDLLGKLKQ